MLTRHLRETFRLRKGGPLVWPAIRAFLSMLVPLTTLLQIGRLDLVAGAVFGALTSVHARSEPYRQQARTLAVVAVSMVLAVAIGDVIAVFAEGSVWHEPLALLATAVVGAVTTAAGTAVHLGAPGGLIFAFATGACAHLSLATTDLGPHISVTAVSAAFAWAVSTAGAVVSGLGPQRRAVAAALEATAAHLAARPDLTTRHRAAAAVETAWNSVALVGRRHRDTAEHLDLVRAIETCEALLIPDHGAEVAIDDIRATATELRRGGRFHGLVPEGDSRPLVPPTPVSRWKVIREVLRAALRPGRHAGTWLRPFALRVGTAAFVAGAAANLLGIGHAYWAAVSAVSVLQATSTSRSVPRMLQRISGTVFGVLGGLGLLSAHPAPWMIIILLAVLQWGAEMTVLVNYAFGLFFATPVALLVSALASPAGPGELVLHRLWATLLGAAIAVGVAWLLPNRAWLSRVQRALARVRELSAADPIQPDRLRSALVELHEAYDVADGEVRRAKLPTEELLDISHRAYVLLDSPEGLNSPDGRARCLPVATGADDRRGSGAAAQSSRSGSSCQEATK
ncbi:fusaric acid resistance family protein [Halopolyspora algeriensis]|uniref:Fusaric acid resistance family protein n=1 Tax=Halopolyspora algeriensis TaxID=1500506 RepID=A0A368VV30_9ACTN|nr:fusaric acid resistance family protein [Halopolyspora algeriensis]TQM55878.1 fusaric acid resistance family protein [Halopolyspora algeriensis]